MTLESRLELISRQGLVLTSNRKGLPDLAMMKSNPNISKYRAGYPSDFVSFSSPLSYYWELFLCVPISVAALHTSVAILFIYGMMQPRNSNPYSFLMYLSIST